MTNELTTITTIRGGLEVLDPSVIKDAKLLEASNDLYKLQMDGIKTGESAKAVFADIRRRQAVILHQIERSGLYKKDGYKTVFAFAKALGFQSSTASQLIGAGKVYGQTEAEAIRALPPSMAYELRGVDAKYLEADADRLAGMTQEELRAYRDKHVEDKPKVITRYTCNFNGKVQELEIDGRKTNLATIEQWHSHLDGYEIQPIKADEDGNKREVAIDGNRAFLVKYRSEKAGGKNGKVKTYTIEELLSMGIDPAKLVDLK